MMLSDNATGVLRHMGRPGKYRGAQVWMRLHEPSFLGCIDAGLVDQIPWQVDLSQVMAQRTHAKTGKHRLVKLLHGPEHECKDAHVDDMGIEIGFKLAHVNQTCERCGLAEHCFHKVVDDLLSHRTIERSASLCPLKQALYCCC